MEAYLRYGPALVRKAQRLLGNTADAQDVVQALFVDLVSQGSAQVELPYLYRAVTNRCLTLLRDGGNRLRLLSEHGELVAPAPRTRKTQYDWLRYSQYDAVPVATWQDRIGTAAGVGRSLDVQLTPTGAVLRNKAIAAYSQGREALEERDAQAAKQKFLEAVTIDPGLAEAWPVLARLYMNDGQYAKAAEAAETYLRHDPGSTDVMTIAYDAYFALGDRARLQPLREKLGRVPELAPKLAVHTYNEGAEAYGAGDYDAAIAAYRAAIELLYVVVDRGLLRQIQFCVIILAFVETPVSSNVL